MPSGYAAPRSSTTGAGTTAGRYSGHADPSRFVYSAPLRRAAGARGGKQMEVAGYMSDGDILGKDVRMDELSSG